MLKKRIALLIAIVMMAVMALPMSANFTPSATMKPAPTVVPDENGNVAEIVDGNGNVIAEITAQELIITPYEDKDEAPYEEITDRLELAYEQITSADSLSDLCAELNSVVQEYAPELSAETVIVGDLFDVTVVGENGQIIAQEGNQLVVQFELTYDAADLVAVLQLVGNEWVAIPNSNIIRNDDNTVIIRLEDLGVLAFLVDSGELIVPDDGPDSPQTGAADEDSSFVPAFICSVGALVCAVAAITVARKKIGETK